MRGIRRVGVTLTAATDNDGKPVTLARVKALVALAEAMGIPPETTANIDGDEIWALAFEHQSSRDEDLVKNPPPQAAS